MLRHLLILGLFWAPLSIASQQPESALKPAPEHALTNRAVVHHLYQHHYSRKYLNDEFSQKVYKRYLNILDNTRSYFTQSDINEFAKLELELDDAIKTNDLKPAFIIYNRYQQRAIERLDHALKLVNKGSKQFDFKKDDSLNLDRETAPWAKKHTRVRRPLA